MGSGRLGTERTSGRRLVNGDGNGGFIVAKVDAGCSRYCTHWSRLSALVSLTNLALSVPCTSSKAGPSPMGTSFDHHVDECKPSGASKRRHRNNKSHGASGAPAGKRHKSGDEAVVASEVSEVDQPRSPADEGGYNSEDEYSHLGLQLTNEEWEEKDRRFERVMKKKGYIIKTMVEDGSCLFRAVADQVYGDQEMHVALRRHCMNYIVSTTKRSYNAVTNNALLYFPRHKTQTTFLNT